MKETKEYYENLQEEAQVVFVDFINDLIKSVDMVNRIKSVYNNIPQEHRIYLQGIVELFKKEGINKISGCLLYKRRDYSRSKCISNCYNINLSNTFATLSMMRREYARKLALFKVIEILPISSQIFYSVIEMQKDGFVKGKGKQKYFNLSILESEYNEIINKLKKGISINRKETFTLILHRVLQEFALGYGEDELNEELNRDKSYNETLFFIGDKENLQKLYAKLTGKDIILEKPIFSSVKGELKYKNKNLEFKIGKLPYYLLCSVFEDKNNCGIDINDFNDYLKKKGYLHSIDYEQIMNAQKSINRRFKGKLEGKKCLLVSKGKAIFREKSFI